MFRLSILLCLVCAACGAQPPDDKSQYNLFNPVPADQMRPFSTDAAPRLQPSQP